ncbi:MAG: hypothetical protein ABL983_03950 [Nitrospira sp.]
MARGKYQQEAHLRVVQHHEGRYQLLFFADLLDFDLYAGPHGVQNVLRSSWHETGQVHIHTPEGRKLGPPRVMPQHFEGTAKLYSGGYTGPDWSYRPKPDSLTRRTLILDKRSIERSLTLDIWAIEAMRDDLVAEVLAEYSGARGIDLVSHATVAGTRPQLMAVAGTLTLPAWDSLRSPMGAGGRS